VAPGLYLELKMWLAVQSAYLSELAGSTPCAEPISSLNFSAASRSKKLSVCLLVSSW
jgi:hypothetical protein